jgi:Antibiotic biosynthesis monooxygenase
MKLEPGPGFTVLYRWRLREGMEKEFVEAWSRISFLLRNERGSLGSRLHRGNDGIWYSYAQWPSAEVRAKSASQPSVDPDAAIQMSQAIEESLPDIVLESVSDSLSLPVASDA